MVFIFILGQNTSHHIGQGTELYSVVIYFYSIAKCDFLIRFFFCELIFFSVTFVYNGDISYSKKYLCNDFF